MFNLKCALCDNATDFVLTQNSRGVTQIECVNYEEHDEYMRNPGKVPQTKNPE
ncbi:hypothetical protein GCM10010423_64780 [Streptomyces levis]|uniref:Uncharacterized protein n=1 Tax=Streptomyces levis TaxID=285566 RepID=A0ABN3P2F8_9ACTN